MSRTKRIYTRRQFLKIIAVSSAAGLGLKLGFDQQKTRTTVQNTRVLMGTLVNLTLICDSSKQAEAALTAMFNTMISLEGVLSHYHADSQVSQLNLEGHLDAAHPVLLAMLEQAQHMSVLSDGAFDITIKPLVDLYTQHKMNNAMPSASEIRDTLKLVDYRKINIQDNQISFTKTGMALSLNSIAKGYIVDQGVMRLRNFGFDNVLVEAGGDLAASGHNALDQPWQIGVRPPRIGSGELLRKLDITNQAVATSGDYQQPFTADLSQHHILDPRTGYSAPELASATITAPSAALADALATSIMVLGPEYGGKLVQSIPDCGGLFISKNTDIYEFGQISNKLV